MTVSQGANLETAIEKIQANELVAYPTETVWGLAANACSDDALRCLQNWKGRAGTQPISILIDTPQRLETFEFEIPDHGAELIKHFWPGPLTLIFSCPKSRRKFAAGVARQDGAVGVRCSSHPTTQAFSQALFAAGLGPVTATSFNRSGAPPVKSYPEALALWNQGAEPVSLFVGNAESAEVGKPGTLNNNDEISGTAQSTVVDFASPSPRVLRWGDVTREDFERIGFTQFA